MKQPFVCEFQFQITLFVTLCEICLRHPALCFGNRQVNKVFRGKKTKPPASAHSKATFEGRIINIFIRLTTKRTEALANAASIAQLLFEFIKGCTRSKWIAKFIARTIIHG